jgi:mRNA-degrading endonuclease RelE of RelBE toxin-antitoxin system
VVLNKVNVDVTRKVNNAVKTLSKEAPEKVSEIVTQGVVDNKKEKLKEVINNPPRR